MIQKIVLLVMIIFHTACENYSDRTIRPKNISNAKQIFIAIWEYSENEGMSPKSLDDLIDYSNSKSISLDEEILFFVSESDSRLRKFNYFPPQGSTSDWRPNSVLLSSPFEAKGRDKRLIMKGSGAVEYISESKYELLLARKISYAEQGAAPNP